MKTSFNKLWYAVIDKAKKAAWFLGGHGFSIILCIIFLELIFGGFLFYKYVFLVEKQAPKIADSSLQFKDDTYQSILNEWQNRNQKNQDFSEKNYSSPF